MNRLSKLFISSVGTYLAGMMLFAGTDDAVAAERRLHSSICHYYYDNAGTGLYNGAYLSTNSTARSIFCPVVSDNTLFHTNVVQLNVHGYESSGESNYSRACSIDPWSSSAACGTTKYWGSGWNGAYGINLSQWNNLARFPYIYTYLDSNGRLHGYYMADY